MGVCPGSWVNKYIYIRYIYIYIFSRKKNGGGGQPRKKDISNSRLKPKKASKERSEIKTVALPVLYSCAKTPKESIF